MYEYRTAAKSAAAELTEKRSRFISRVIPVTAEEEAVGFINEMRKTHWDAAHNVYAYVLRENNIQRYSDDGEPAGTSGMPTLDVIRKEGLTDICIVITRYFGGILLGAGGLVRAYTKSAKQGVDAAGILRRIVCYEYTIKTDYSLLGRVQSAAAEAGAMPDGVDYSDDVTLKYLVPYSVNGFGGLITDITNGRAEVTVNNEGRYADAK